MGSTNGVFWKTDQQIQSGGVFWNTNQTPQTVSQPWQNNPDWKPTQSQMNGFYNRLKNGLTLKQGSQGLEVALLQYRLKQFVEQRTFGLAQIEVDGKFGPGTESVVRAFQRFINQTVSCDGGRACLKVDGIVGNGVAIHLENAFPQPRK